MILCLLLLAVVGVINFSERWFGRFELGPSCPAWCDGGCGWIDGDEADFRKWEIELAAARDPLTAVLDEVFPDGRP